MSKWTSALLIMGLFSTGALMAAEEATLPANKQRTVQTVDRGAEWTKMQTKLKADYPEEFAEIEKLSSTNLFAAMEKFRALAKKAGMEMPMGGGRGMMGQGQEGRGMMGQGQEGRGMMGGMMGQGGMMNEDAKAEATLKENYPEEFAEIEELRAQLETKLQALAKKGNVKLDMTPQRRNAQMKMLKEKYPTEFAEIEQLRQTDPRASFEKLKALCDKEGIEFAPQRNRQGNDNAAQEAPKRKNEATKMRGELLKKYPEEMKEIDSLRKKDPDAAKTKLQALVKKYQAEKK